MVRIGNGDRAGERGRSGFVDSNGNSWSADTGYNTGNAATSATTWTGPDAPLYSTERRDPAALPELEYSFPVSPGTYTVNLYFAEIDSGTACVGCRQFGVAINGTTVLDHFDVFAAVGVMQPLAKSFPVTVSGGQVVVSFVHEIENPKISGIEIIPQ